MFHFVLYLYVVFPTCVILFCPVIVKLVLSKHVREKLDVLTIVLILKHFQKKTIEKEDLFQHVMVLFKVNS